MKESLIEEIKKLILTNSLENIEINPNYLDYFEESELIEIRDKLQLKKKNINNMTNDYLDELYSKTKKDEL